MGPMWGRLDPRDTSGGDGEWTQEGKSCREVLYGMLSCLKVVIFRQYSKDVFIHVPICRCYEVCVFMTVFSSNSSFSCYLSTLQISHLFAGILCLNSFSWAPSLFLLLLSFCHLFFLLSSVSESKSLIWAGYNNCSVYTNSM